MFNDASGFDQIYIACEYTDLRRGINGLAGIVQNEFHLNPFQNILFLFCGRTSDRIKGLLWEGNGVVLLYKRLEDSRYQWPRNENEVRNITPQQYRWLTEGLSIEPKKSVHKVRPKRAS